MPKKSLKWGVKVWCVVDSKSKFIYDFDIYYEQIKSFTIESRIIYTTDEDIKDLINEKVIRKDLEEKMNQAIDELGGYVFFKMHRSPKDAFQSKIIFILTIKYKYFI